MKSVCQVTNDSSTGQMHEEAGSSSGSQSSHGHRASSQSYFQSYQAGILIFGFRNVIILINVNIVIIIPLIVIILKRQE